VILKILLNT